MSEQNKRASTSTPADPPVKRKRGRPRKDENLVQKEKTQLPQPPPSDDLRINQRADQVDRGDDIEDDMVGQVVSGVIEGSFDAGYFLSVRAGSSNTLLRGVVFQPGLFTPITAANDVAPHAKMYKRREFPIPVFNPQGQVNGSISQSEGKNEQPVQLESQAPKVPTQVLPSEFQTGSPYPLANQCAENMPQQNSKSGAPFALADQSSSVKVPETGTLVKNDPAGASLEISEFGLENQSTSQLQSGAPFPLANQSAFAKVLMSDSLGAKNVPQLNSEFGLENQFAHQLRSGVPFGLPTQSASVMIPVTSNLPENNSGPSLGGNNLPQQNSDSGLEKQSILQLQLGTPFPLASLPNNNSGASMGGKDMPRQNSEPALDNQPIPQFQSGTPFALVSHNLPKNNDSGASLGGRNMPQQNSEFGLENLSTPQLEIDRIAEQDEIMQELGASTLLERPQIDVEGTKVVMPEIASELTFDLFPSKESINQVSQVQHQAVDSGLESSKLAQNELKSRNLELHQTLVDPKPISVPPEKPISPKNDTPGRHEITNNGKPITEAADNGGVSQSARKANEPVKIMEEATPSESELNNTGGGFHSLPKTNQLVTFMQEKAASSEPEAAAGGTLVSGKGIPSL